MAMLNNQMVYNQVESDIRLHGPQIPDEWWDDQTTSTMEPAGAIGCQRGHWLGGATRCHRHWSTSMGHGMLPIPGEFFWGLTITFKKSP